MPNCSYSASLKNAPFPFPVFEIEPEQAPLAIPLDGFLEWVLHAGDLEKRLIKPFKDAGRQHVSDLLICVADDDVFPLPLRCCLKQGVSKGSGLEKGICKSLSLPEQPALKMAKGLSGLQSREMLALICEH